MPSPHESARSLVGHSGGHGRIRRYLVDPPLPRRTFRQRSVHVCVRIPSVAGALDRHGGGDSQLSGRGHQGIRARFEDPLRASCSNGELVERTQALDGRGIARRYGRTLFDDHRLPVVGGGVLRPSSGFHPEVERVRSLQGNGGSSAALAERSGLCRKAGDRDRLGRDGRDADPGARRNRGACDDASTVADVLHVGSVDASTGHHPSRTEPSRRMAR